ncbi:MAG: hypothetical protein V2A34_04330 [Lentisphaerota bacterium]
MKYTADLDVNEEGDIVATCDELGLSGKGISTVCALDALRLAIRYQLELCPCSSIDEDYIELEVAP